MSKDEPVPPEVIALMPKIGTDAFGIWVFLWSNSDHEGNIDVSYPAISDGTGVKAKATVSACLKMLVAVGLLERRRNYSAAVSYRVLPIRSRDELLDKMNPINTTLLINTESIKREEVESSILERMADGSSKLERIGITAGMAASQWQRMTDEQQAEYMFQQVTGMLSIPSRNRQLDVSNVGKMLKEYGPDETIRRMKEAYEVWGTKRTKEGRFYSKLNTGWIEWAVNGEIPGVTDAPPDPMAAIYAMYPKFSASDPR